MDHGKKNKGRIQPKDIDALKEAVELALRRVEDSQVQLNTFAETTEINLAATQAAVGTAIKKLKDVDAEIDKVKVDTHDLGRYAIVGALGQSVIGFGLSTAEFATAITNHSHPQEISGHFMKMTGSVVIGASLVGKALEVLKVVGRGAYPWLGPVCVLIGECFLAAGSAMVGAVPQKSLSDQIKEELAEFSGDEKRYQMDGVLDAIERMYADLKGRTDSSLSWDDVNRIGRFTGPDEVIWLGAVESWLHEKLEAEVWPKVFTAYAHVSGQYLQNLMEGFRKIKWHTDVTNQRTDDMKSGTLVLEAICAQYQDMLEKLLPLAGLRAQRWFVGSNGNVYCAEHGDDGRVGEYDTRATAISIGSDGDRIWTIGENRRVYTYDKQSGSWKNLHGYGTDDILVVRKTGTRLDHVFMLRNGAIDYWCWDEAQEGWPKIVADAPCPFKVPVSSGNKIKKLAASGRGALFLLREKEPTKLDVHDERNSGKLLLPDGFGPEGMTANEDRLYIYSSDTIYWVNVVEALNAAPIVADETPSDFLPTWNVMNLPKGSSLKSLFASPDGTLLGVLSDDRMHLCFDDNGDTWHETDSNTAQKAVMWPMSGWETYARLESLVKGIADMRDAKLAETEDKSTTEDDKSKTEGAK